MHYCKYCYQYFTHFHEEHMAGDSDLVRIYEERDRSTKQLADERQSLLDTVEQLQTELEDLRSQQQQRGQSAWPPINAQPPRPRADRPLVRETIVSTAPRPIAPLPRSSVAATNAAHQLASTNRPSGSKPPTTTASQASGSKLPPPRQEEIPHYKGDPYDNMEDDDDDTLDPDLVREILAARTSNTAALLNAVASGVVMDALLVPGRGNPINPKTRGEWEFICEWIREHQDERVLALIRQWRNYIVNNKYDQTDLAIYVRRNWTNPSWAKPRHFDIRTGSLVETDTTRGGRPNKQNTAKEELANIAEQLGIVPGSQEYRNLGNVGGPNETAHPYVWIRWFMRFLKGSSRGSTPRGIDQVTTTRGTLTLDENQLRAYLRIRPIFPKMGGDLAAMGLLAALTVLSIPGRYQLIVEENHLTINSTPSWSPAQIGNTTQSNTELEIVRILADRGLTYDDALDARSYAISYLESSSRDESSDVDTRSRAAAAYQAAMQFPVASTPVYPDGVSYAWNATYGRWIPQRMSPGMQGTGQPPGAAATQTSSVAPTGASGTAASSSSGAPPADISMEEPSTAESNTQGPSGGTGDRRMDVDDGKGGVDEPGSGPSK